MGLTHQFAPQVGMGDKETLLSDVTCAASGNLTYTSILAIGNARYVSIALEVDPAAASNVVGIMPLVSMEASKPASGDDVWYMLPASDYALSTVTISGSLPSGADWTALPTQSGITYRGLVLLSPPSTAAANEIRIAYDPINVSGFTWLQFAYWEVGATGTPSNLSLHVRKHL